MWGPRVSSADPRPAGGAARALAAHVGARRFAFRWGLALVQERLEACGRGENGEERGGFWRLGGRGIGQRGPSPPVAGTLQGGEDALGLDGLARALRAWLESRKGRRKGCRVGISRFLRRRAVPEETGHEGA